MTSQRLNQNHQPEANAFDLDACINYLAPWLPTQAPIKDFVYHNTLEAFQHLSYHEAVSVAGKLYGALSYLPLEDYQQMYADGRIRNHGIDWALAQTGCSHEQQHEIRATLFEVNKAGHYPPVALASHGIRNTWLTRVEVDLNSLAHPILFRLLAGFLDQGISHWLLPKEGESFWEVFKRLTQNSLVPLYPFNEPVVTELLDKSLDEIILTCLAKITGSEALYEQYLLEMMLAHPGWSGMVRIVERNPKSLLFRRKVTLKETLAVELLCELAIVQKRKGEGFLTVSELPNLHGIPLLHGDVLQPNIPLRLRVWHEAWEWSMYVELLAAIKTQLPAAKPPETAAKPIPEAQAFFCIDERECSIRRYLEEINPAIETFGMAGFFGIDFYYQGMDDAYPVAQCPIVITPKHLIREASAKPATEKKTQKAGFDNIHFSKHTMLRDWLYSQLIGIGYALKMAWNVFRPSSKLPRIKSLGEVEAHSHLHLLRENEETNEDGHLLGFSFQEMADRVGGLLRNIGLTQNFAPLVVVIAHGSSSVNNPLFAAYDCGACASKPGSPNARAFAWMANREEVRVLLRNQSIDIPDTTRFISALHNTSRDEITYFDQHELAQHPAPGLHKFKQDMQHALLRNARERCRWFELAPKSNSNKDAHEHVISRASSIFEPRPEMDHSNNLYAIVGPRAVTRHLFIDRRAFMHSYAPETDVQGDILLRILSAVIPVCGGINLEYLFSRIDNSVYGAGSKLPHNVIGLLGVANGVEGDLRTGLPQQAIEVHEPARLLIVVIQNTAVIDKTVARLGGLKEWLDNDWVRFVACEPDTGHMFLYRKNGWEDVELPTDYIPQVANRSEEIILGHHKAIPVHVLSGRVS